MVFILKGALAEALSNERHNVYNLFLKFKNILKLCVWKKYSKVLAIGESGYMHILAGFG